MNFDFNKLLADVDVNPPAGIETPPAATPAATPATPVAAKTPESIVSNLLNNLENGVSTAAANPTTTGVIPGTTPPADPAQPAAPTAAEIARGFITEKSPQDLIFESIAASRGVTVDALVAAISSNPAILASLTGGAPTAANPVEQKPATPPAGMPDLSTLNLDPAAMAVITNMSAQMEVLMQNQAALTAKNNMLEQEQNNVKNNGAVHTFVDELINNIGVPAASASEFLTSVKFDASKLNDAAYVSIVKEFAKTKFPTETPVTPAATIASTDSSITGAAATGTGLDYDAIDKILKDSGM